MTDKQHDHEAIRRDKLLAERRELAVKFRKADESAAARIAELEVPLHETRRERLRLSQDYRHAIWNLDNEREACERALLESANPEIIGELVAAGMGAPANSHW